MLTKKQLQKCPVRQKSMCAPTQMAGVLSASDSHIVRNGQVLAVQISICDPLQEENFPWVEGSSSRIYFSMI